MPAVAVIDVSAQGYTHQLAEAVGEGVRGVPGATAELVRIVGADIAEGRWKNPAAMATLAAADAIVFGTPTYMGGYAMQHSMVWVSPGLEVEGYGADQINRLGCYSGVMAQTEVNPGDRKSAVALGKRAAEVAARWAKGA